MIPALDEAENLRLVLPALPTVHQIIVVDGGSEDDTIDTVRELLPQAEVLTQRRRGKGNALVTGFAAVTGDIAVMFDADGSADPSEISAFVEALLAGADFAKGSRFCDRGGSADITPLRRLGNWFLSTVVNHTFDTRFSDLCYGYNAFWADQLPVLDLPDPTRPAPADGAMTWGDGFEIETVINCRFVMAGAAITEVPSVERARIHGVSNLHAVRDGLRVLRTIRAERRGIARCSDPMPATPRPTAPSRRSRGGALSGRRRLEGGSPARAGVGLPT